jgi:hypothetical protein
VENLFANMLGKSLAHRARSNRFDVADQPHFSAILNAKNIT